LYLSALHVPLLILMPGERRPKGRIATPVSLKDLAATVLEMAGVPKGTLPGTPLSTYWADTSEGDGPSPGSPSVLSPAIPAELRIHPSKAQHEDQEPVRSLLSDRYHYVRQVDGSEELYDIVDDMWERSEVTSGERAELLRQFRRSLHVLFASGGV
ncbi:MAG: hypothetical protein ACREK1_12930, partial [Longimicrobiales bacterium]